MTYKRKCEKCKKVYQALRPHSRFCSEACRVGSYNIQKRKEEKVKHLKDELKHAEDMMVERKIRILEIETSLSKQEASLQSTHQKQQKVEKSLSLGFLFFYMKYQGKKEPFTKKIVPSSNMNYKAGTAKANLIFEDRKKRLSTIKCKLRSAIEDHQREIQHLQSVLQKEEKELVATKKAIEKYQGQLDLMLQGEMKAEITDVVVTASTLLPTAPKIDQSIGAADLLKKDIRTFLLPGPIGEFLGELERNMLAIAMVGDAGAGKSTMTMAIARAFDLAGYRTIFYSLEIGMGKPLQDMIKRNPLSNQVRITDKGDLAAVRESAKSYDLLIVDSFGKLGCKAEEWDRLRQNFPDTMFLAIFQKTSSGSSRGGASVDYDASMVINLTRDKESGKRVAHMRKSRYGTQDWRYYPEENRIEKI